MPLLSALLAIPLPAHARVSVPAAPASVAVPEAGG
jgi:hypothetical protein